MNRKKSRKKSNTSGKTPVKRVKGRNGRTKKASGKAWIWHLLIISGLFVSAWVLWLDHSISNHFEGQRWALPARVFARPLELFPGKVVALKDIKAELDILGYRHVTDLSKQGEYSIIENTLRINTRGFTFSDAADPSQKVKVQLSGSRIQYIRNIELNRDIYLLRIEPVEIAKIYPAHNEDRILIKLDEVPPLLIKILLAVEDRNFYQHIGIDPRGIARAFLANLKAMKIKQGASTLTQQLIKNFFLTHDRTLWRKLNEMVMALLLEYHYSKNEILEAYLNEVFLGQDNKRAIHGFGLASEYYFAAPLSELRTDQLAMLVGLVKGASYYNPRRHPQRALERRNVVIKRITQLALLNTEQQNWLLKAKLDIKPRRSLSRSRYPAFTDLVRHQLQQDYAEEDLRTAGLRVFTTLDPIIQKHAEKALIGKINQLEKQKNLSGAQLQGAVIVTDTKSGEIQAVVGGRDNKNSYNRAVSASRQIGSLIKPVIYLEAINQGKTLADAINDVPVQWKNERGEVWQPGNYDKSYHGQIPLITALANSYNAATVSLGRELGVENIVKRLQSLGLNRAVPAYPSLLLGAVELSPLEVSRIYQTLANDGFSIPPRTIKAVLTQGNKLLQRYQLEIGQVIKPDPAFLIQYAMTEVMRNGTGRAASAILPAYMPLAGKTGTTDNLRDSWFAGFDNNTLTIVWMGRDDNKSAGLTGASGALRVWIDLMKNISVTPLELNAADGIKWYWVNPQTFRITKESCAGAVRFPLRQDMVSDRVTSCQDDKGIKGLFDGWLN